MTIRTPASPRGLVLASPGAQTGRHRNMELKMVNILLCPAVL